MAAKPTAAIKAVSLSVELSGLLRLIQEKDFAWLFFRVPSGGGGTVLGQCWVRKPRAGAGHRQWLLGWCVPAGRDRGSRAITTLLMPTELELLATEEKLSFG